MSSSMYGKDSCTDRYLSYTDSYTSYTISYVGYQSGNASYIYRYAVRNRQLRALRQLH